MNKNLTAAALELKNTESKLILVGAAANEDTFAAALAFHLLLSERASSTVVASNLPSLELSTIHGIAEVTTQLPSPNLVITLRDAVGVVEKVSYFIEGTELKLIVHPQPDAKQFDKKNITIDQGNVLAKTVLILGADSENDLAAILKERKIPEDAHIVVVSANATIQLGTVKAIDSESSSVSEIAAQIIEEIGMPADDSLTSDIVHNLLTGIRAGTQNFTSSKVRPETFELAARLTRLVKTAPMSQAAAMPDFMLPGNELSAELPIRAPAQIVQPQAATDPTQAQAAKVQDDQTQQQPAKEPEPDWLTPKIYKGTSLL